MPPPRRKRVDLGSMHRLLSPAFVLIICFTAAAAAAIGGEGSAGGRVMSAEVRARVAEARNRARQLAQLGIVGARGREAREGAAQQRAAGRREYDRILRKARRAAAAGDGWCRGLSDGLHGDPLAHPPRSAYFRCSGFSLSGLYFCPEAACFDEERGECVEERTQAESTTAGGEIGPAAWWASSGSSSSIRRGSSSSGVSSSSSSSSSGGGRNEGYSKESETEGALGAAEVAHTEREEGRANWREEGRTGSRRAALREAGGAGGRSLDATEKGIPDTNTRAGIVLDVPAAAPPAAAPSAAAPSSSSDPSSGPPVDQQAAAELNALLEFKASVIDFRNVLRSWVVPRSASNATDPYSFLCTWRFVTCSKPAPPSKGRATAAAASPRRVIALEIKENAEYSIGILLTSTCNITNSIATTVQGSSSSSSSGSTAIPPLLPQSFSSLTALQTLTIQNSPYYPGIAGVLGAFPTQLSACSFLQKLDLAYQRILGGISDEISRLKSLKVLSLNYNLMTGSLPSSLFSLPGLEILKLPSNAISGSIPPQISLLSKTLMDLDLHNNHLSGTLPEEIGQLRKLGIKPDFAGLNLQGNNFSGPLPSSITNLKSLQNLDLRRNQFSGSLPQGGAFLSSLTSLVALQLSFNHFSGSLPLAFACTASVMYLNFNNNQFSGTLPGNFDNCAMMLTSLDVSGNNLTGQLPPGMWKSLAAAYMPISLFLKNNSFTGSLSPAFGQITTIGCLDVSNNKLSGPLPDLKSCPVATSLTDLYLANNSFSGSVPPGFICKQLQKLDLRNNSLSGDLPEVLVGLNIGQLKNGAPSPAAGAAGKGGAATAAAMGAGQKGAAATAAAAAILNSSPHLLELNISHNSFTGPIPLGGDCRNLTKLLLDHNNFSGPAVPDDVATCLNLTNYDVSENQLTGTVADSLGKFTKTAGLATLRLRGNKITGEIPTGVFRLSSIGELDLSGNQITGSIPGTLSALNRLQFLNLSRNGLSSSIPASLGNLSFLSILDVSFNALSYSIPPELSPPFLPFLSLLNLSHNTLTGTIPYGFTNTNTTATLLDFSFNFLQGQIYPGNLSALPASSFAGNPGLCGGAGYPPCPEPPNSGLSTGAIAGITVGCVVALAAAVALLWFLLFYRRASGFEGGTMLVFERLDFKLNIRSVINATDNFSNKYLLGRGGFGSVYKATLADGRDVAIKRLALGSSQGEREFEAEMSTLGNVRHRNLVVLVAAYLSRPPSQERLLIYDFLPGGSLDHVLARDMPQGGGKGCSCHSASGPLNGSASCTCSPSPMRRWEVRRNILVGTARGMKYLHHNCNPGIIHRDMKPANVLLDDNFEAKVADFGLAREIDVAKSHLSTGVFGTIGYLAPEYSQRGRLSFKSDVFAFGVLVLQMITGKLPTDEDLAERGLSRWVGANPLARIVDRRIDDREEHADEIQAVATLGLRCTSRVAADRPSMAEVLEMLEQLSALTRDVEGEEGEVGGAAGEGGAE